MDSTHTDYTRAQNFQRVSLNKTDEFPFRFLTFVYMKYEMWKNKKKSYFITKILISTRLPNPVRETRVPKPCFITIHCLKFWAQAKQDRRTNEIKVLAWFPLEIRKHKQNHWKRNVNPQTSQTAYLLSQGGLRRPKLTRHDKLCFYDRF